MGDLVGMTGKERQRLVADWKESLVEAAERLGMSYRQVKRVWAVDRGMVSADTLRELRRGGANSIAGERLRAGTPVVEEALSPHRAVPAGA